MQGFVLFWPRVSAIVAASMIVAACGSSGAPAPGAPTSAPAKTDAPKAEQAKPGSAPEKPAAAAPAAATKKLVMGIAPPAREVNDIRHAANTELWVLRPMHEFLVGTDPQTGKYVPQLATEWKVEPDGRSVRFMLRKGVQFHQGKGEFTAKDVRFVWEEMKKEDGFNGWRTFFATAISDVEIVNDYEVVFKLTREDSSFLNIISEGENGFEIRSKAHFDQIGPPSLESGPLAGTGPYQFKERAQGQFVRFEKVPYQHWRVQPEFSELEYRFQREASTRYAALKAGEVHITVLPPDLRADAEKNGYKTLESKVPGLRTFMRFYCCILEDPKAPEKGYLYPESPLMDVRVRKALNKAINRDEMNKAFFDGKGERMMLPHHHPTRQGWDKSWEQRWQDEYGYDPAAARALLAEAGYGAAKPFATSLFVQPIQSIAPAQDMQEAVGGYWRSIGVNIELLSTDPAEVQTVSRARKYSNHVQQSATNSALFTGMTGYFLTWGNRANGYEDADVDRISLEAVSTFDEAKQEDAWRRVGEIMFAKHVALPFFWLPAEAVANAKVLGDYSFPGNISGTWTHQYTMKAAP